MPKAKIQRVKVRSLKRERSRMGRLEKTRRLQLKDHSRLQFTSKSAEYLFASQLDVELFSPHKIHQRRKYTGKVTERPLVAPLESVKPTSQAKATIETCRQAYRAAADALEHGSMKRWEKNCEVPLDIAYPKEANPGTIWWKLSSLQNTRVQAQAESQRQMKICTSPKRQTRRISFAGMPSFHIVSFTIPINFTLSQLKCLRHVN